MAASTNSTHTLSSQTQSQSNAKEAPKSPTKFASEVAKNVSDDVDNKQTTATETSKLPVVVEGSAESVAARIHDLEMGECDAKAREDALVNKIYTSFKIFPFNFLISMFLSRQTFLAP